MTEAKICSVCGGLALFQSDDGFYRCSGCDPVICKRIIASILQLAQERGIPTTVIEHGGKKPGASEETSIEWE